MEAVHIHKNAFFNSHPPTYVQIGLKYRYKLRTESLLRLFKPNKKLTDLEVFKFFSSVFTDNINCSIVLLIVDVLIRNIVNVFC